MTIEQALAVLFRWLHVGAAIVAVGGVVFQRFVLMPALSAVGDEARVAIRDSVLARWRLVVHSSIAILLVSGTYNAWRLFPMHKGQPIYHSIFGVKVLIALAVFGIAAVVTGRSERAQRMRGRAPFWLGLLVALGTAVVLLSGVLKNVPISTAP